MELKIGLLKLSDCSSIRSFLVVIVDNLGTDFRCLDFWMARPYFSVGNGKVFELVSN